MTRKHRPSPPSPELSASYSAATGGKHRRRIPRKKTIEEEEEEDNDDSGSQSLESQGDEYEAFDEEEDDGGAASESVSNAPGDLSSSNSQAPSYVPESNNIKGKSTSMSASDFPYPSQPIITESSSYVKIAPLPIFRGTSSECPVTHLSRFNKVCRANNASSVDMLMRIFPVTLEEEASLWYDMNIEPYPSLSWDEIKLSFLQAYYKIELVDGLRSELMGINQGEKESVRSYFLRLQWVLKRWPEHGLHDAMLKGVFIDGLRAEFHDWVLLQKPNSLNDALRLAFSFEQLRSIRGKKQMVPTCGFCEGLHEEDNCEVREGMKELWRQGKQKEGSVSSARSGSDKAGKDFVRSFSMGASSGEGKIETDEGEKGGEAMVGNMKKNQCQCAKHQCWKKKLIRNNSLASRISHHD